MSTEAKITPYEGGKNNDRGIAGDVELGAIGLAAGATVALGVGLVTLAAKGLTLDEKQKETLLRYKEEERKERARLKIPETLQLTVVPLKLKTPETLVQSAANLGFKLQPLEMVSVRTQPNIILSKPSGETLTVRRAETGRLVIEAGNASIIQQVVQRHTIDQTISHLKKQCRSVEVKKTHGGYIIVGQETNRRQKGGTAKIITHIQNNGVATVDVSNIKGSRCEEVINELARAIGGECVEAKRKSEYFQLPAEEQERVHV